MNNVLEIREFDPRMVEIHAESFDFGWKDSYFQEYFTRPYHPILGIYGPQGLEAFVIASLVADEAEILTIATAASARRQGHARRLMRHLVATLSARSTNSLFLEVATDNPAAIALYLGLGFREVGKRRAYYSRRGGRLVDALILSLAIPPNCP